MRILAHRQRKPLLRVSILWLFCLCIASVIGIANAHGDVGGTTTLTGSVRVLDRDGRTTTDHSGVVVFVDGIGSQASPSVSDSTHAPRKLSQRGRTFNPRTLAITQGTSVEFLNDDSTFHNVFSLSKAKSFDLGIYARNSSKQVTFDTPGLVRVYCNIHPNMVSNILVLNNALFSITPRDGAFAIAGVPKGEVTLRYWNEFGREEQRKIRVAGDAMQLDPVELVQSNRVRTHKNKFGRTYKAKY